MGAPNESLWGSRLSEQSGDREDWQPQKHLGERSGDRWDKPKGARETDCHLMVQVMESWFLADREALSRFFGEGSHDNVLPAQSRPIRPAPTARANTHSSCWGGSVPNRSLPPRPGPSAKPFGLKKGCSFRETGPALGPSSAPPPRSLRLPWLDALAERSARELTSPAPRWWQSWGDAQSRSPSVALPHRLRREVGGALPLRQLRSAGGVSCPGSPRPFSAPEAVPALPAQGPPRCTSQLVVVGGTGFEPVTPRV